MEQEKPDPPLPEGAAATNGSKPLTEKYVKKTVFNVQSYDTDFDPETNLATSTLNLLVTETLVQEQNIDTVTYPMLIFSSDPTSNELNGNPERGTDTKEPEPKKEETEYTDDVKTGAIKKKPIYKKPKSRKDSSDKKPKKKTSFKGVAPEFCSYCYDYENRNQSLYTGQLSRSTNKNYCGDEHTNAANTLEMKRKTMDCNEYISSELVKKLYPEEEDDDPDDAVAAAKIEDATPSARDPNVDGVFELELDNEPEGCKKDDGYGTSEASPTGESRKIKKTGENSNSARRALKNTSNAEKICRLCGILSTRCILQGMEVYKEMAECALNIKVHQLFLLLVRDAGPSTAPSVN